MISFNGTISIDVDESALDMMIKLALSLDESGAFTDDEHAGVTPPPLDVCMSVIANHGEGLDRLITDAHRVTGTAGKVGWVIDIKEVAQA